MIDCVPETRHRVIDGGSVFTEYQGSTEQDYGKIAKDCEEESNIKDDMHQRRGHNKIHTVVSFTAETDFSGEKEEFLSEAQPNRE